MTFKIIECTQRSPEWFEARRGVPTASEFSTILAKGKDGGNSVGRKTYLYKLAGEILSGAPMESFESAAMVRGREMEAEAKNFYQLVNDEPVMDVGFVVNGRCGCSPDAWVGTSGGLEIKTAAPHILIDLLLKDQFPPEHKAQVQGSLMVCEREWWDLMVYWPKMEPLTKRMYRDEDYIATLRTAIDAFNEELDAVVEKVRRYGVKT